MTDRDEKQPGPHAPKLDREDARQGRRVGPWPMSYVMATSIGLAVFALLLAYFLVF